MLDELLLWIEAYMLAYGELPSAQEISAESRQMGLNCNIDIECLIQIESDLEALNLPEYQAGDLPEDDIVFTED